MKNAKQYLQLILENLVLLFDLLNQDLLPSPKEKITTNNKHVLLTAHTHLPFKSINGLFWFVQVNSVTPLLITARCLAFLLSFKIKPDCGPVLYAETRSAEQENVNNSPNCRKKLPVNLCFNLAINN